MEEEKEEEEKEEAAAGASDSENLITREVEREPEKGVLKVKENFKEVSNVRCSSNPKQMSEKYFVYISAHKHLSPTS